jgi:hypothetical protein
MILGMTTLPGNRPEALLDLIEGLASEPFDPAAKRPRSPCCCSAGPRTDGAGHRRARGGRADSRVGRVPDHLAALHAPEFRAAVADFLA